MSLALEAKKYTLLAVRLSISVHLPLFILLAAFWLGGYGEEERGAEAGVDHVATRRIRGTISRYTKHANSFPPADFDRKGNFYQSTARE